MGKANKGRKRREQIRDPRPAAALGGALAGQMARTGTPTALSYDGVKDKKRRQAPRTTVRSEDNVLQSAERKKMVATTRDIRRNFAVAAWAIRKHLDFVSRFTFQARTGDPELNKRIESLMKWYNKPANCDSAGRHTLRRMVRMTEASATLDGDVALMKLANGRLQAIEGDRIRFPEYDAPPALAADRKKWTHGIETTPAGRPRRFCICNRKDAGGFKYGRIVQARNILHYGYFDRFDQIRGISPLAPAINTLQDCYENWTYALAKAKIAQLFGLVVTRKAPESLGLLTADTANDDDGEANDADVTNERYTMEVGGGPFKLEMEPGDDAKFLGENSPSPAFADFTNAMIGSAIKSLDLPFSLYDETHGNYYQSRGALIQYLFSCEEKRENLREILNEITTWRMRLWVMDGVLQLPAGMSADDVDYEWIAAGLPWWNPLQETKADVLAIDNTLTTRTFVLKAQGRDFREVVDERFDEEKYILTKQAELDKEFPPAIPAVDNSKPKGPDNGENENE